MTSTKRVLAGAAVLALLATTACGGSDDPPKGAAKGDPAPAASWTRVRLPLGSLQQGTAVAFTEALAQGPGGPAIVVGTRTVTGKRGPAAVWRFSGGRPVVLDVPGDVWVAGVIADGRRTLAYGSTTTRCDDRLVADVDGPPLLDRGRGACRTREGGRPAGRRHCPVRGSHAAPGPRRQAPDPGPGHRCRRRGPAAGRTRHQQVRLRRGSGPTGSHRARGGSRQQAQRGDAPGRPPVPGRRCHLAPRLRTRGTGCRRLRHRDRGRAVRRHRPDQPLGHGSGRVEHQGRLELGPRVAAAAPPRRPRLEPVAERSGGDRWHRLRRRGQLGDALRDRAQALRRPLDQRRRHPRLDHARCPEPGGADALRRRGGPDGRRQGPARAARRRLPLARHAVAHGLLARARPVRREARPDLPATGGQAAAPPQLGPDQRRPGPPGVRRLRVAPPDPAGRGQGSLRPGRRGRERPRRLDRRARHRDALQRRPRRVRRHRRGRLLPRAWGGAWKRGTGFKGPRTEQFGAVRRLGRTWVALGYDRADFNGGTHEYGAVWTSTDGRTRHQQRGGFDVSPGQNSYLGGACATSRGGIVVVGGVRDAARGYAPIAFPRTAAGWKRLDLGGLGTDLRSLDDCVSTGKVTLLQGSTASGPGLWRTTDLKAWDKVTIGGTDDSVGTVRPVQGGFAAAGGRYGGRTAQPVVWLSTDGRTWTSVAVASDRQVAGSDVLEAVDGSTHRLVVLLTGNGGPEVQRLDNFAPLLDYAARQ